MGKGSIPDIIVALHLWRWFLALLWAILFCSINELQR